MNVTLYLDIKEMFYYLKTDRLIKSLFQYLSYRNLDTLTM